MRTKTEDTSAARNEQALIARHKTKLRFENPDMDYMLLVALTYGGRGGASIGEVFRAASRMTDGDPESWTRAWAEVAEHVERQGAEADAKGHRVSARKALLRAYACYRWSEHLIPPGDPRMLETWHKARRCFRRAAELFDPPIEAVDIPFEGGSLPGYFRRADDSGKRSPTLLMIGGAEMSAEELLFCSPFSGPEHGYNCAFFDLPGQGGAIRLHGLPFHADSEKPIAAILDYLLGRPGVDADRLAIHGISLGGYLVTRACVFEKRVKACIANAPIFDTHRLLTAEILGSAAATESRARNPFAEASVQRFLYYFGVDSLPAWAEKTREMSFAGRIGDISCPTLCLVGEGDPKDNQAQTYEFYDQLRVEKKALRVFTAEDAAEAHCQVNNYPLQDQVVFDWLDEVWGNGSPRSS